MQKYFEYVSIILLCLSAIVLIALQITGWGWFLLGAGAVLLFFCQHQFRKHIGLLYLSMAILGVTPISTDISPNHILIMGALLLLSVALPYLISRYLYKDNVVKYKLHHGRNWYKSEIAYIVLTATLAYIFLPIMMGVTGAYKNWMVEPGFENLLLLFIGTNGLGIWDELFFVSTVLGILQRYLSFRLANLAQAVIFTSFLYELGFRSWTFIVIFVFALIQGYIYKRTNSLVYVITIHLVVDLILYFVLIHLHYPTWLPIFITG